MKRSGFSGRLGLILAALGMAIGAGNIWRFPRIAAKWMDADHGAGAFLVAWLVCLLLWSVPILIAEFTLGKVTRRGPVGAYSSLLGRPAAWMGAFIAFTTLMIATYYSVVTGWTGRYLVSAFGGFPDLVAADSAEAIRSNHAAALQDFTGLAGSTEALGWHLGMVLLAVAVVWRGVRTGVELLCKILIPSLFLLLVAGVWWVFTGAEQASAIKGLNYLFDPDWSDLQKSGLWLDALAQSAWSTGAGWGLILAYGSYARKNEDAVVNNATAAVGNNCASILVGCFLFPAAFAMLGAAGLGDPAVREALRENTNGGTGMVFQYIPFIFKGVADYGSLLTILFFGALFIAALSSLIAMYEMGCRVVQDLGVSRHLAVIVIALIIAGVGSVAALDMKFFISMDWVWGVGLIVSGLLIVMAVQAFGVDNYRKHLINETGADLKLGWGFNWLFLIIVPAEGVALLWWFLKDAAAAPPDSPIDPWDPWALGSYNAGTCVWWWGAVLVLFMLLSPILGRFSTRGSTEETEDPS